MASPSVQNVFESNRKLEVLLSVAKTLGQEIHLDRVLAIMVSEVTRAMGAERSTLFLVDERSGELFTKVAEGLGIAEVRVPIGVGLVGAAAAMRQTINISDAYRDPRFNPAVDRKSGFTTRSVLTAPMIDKQDRLIGVVQVLNKCDGEAFTADDAAFLGAMCTHLALAIERAKLVEWYVNSQKVQQSLQLARQIQMGLVPKSFPAFPEKPEIDICGALRPALDVGGDLYDFFMLGDRDLCFVIGDVSDKGIPAALFMAMVRTAFRITAASQRETIADCFRTVNRFLYDHNDSQMFVTMLGGTLDLSSGEVRYTDAGHEPGFLLRAGGGVEMLEKKGGIALGFLEDYGFGCQTLQLSAGDSLVLYTDGINEAMNARGQMFGTHRIRETLESLGADPSAEEITRSLIREVSKFVDGAPQSDDITLLVVRWTGEGRAPDTAFGAV